MSDQQTAAAGATEQRTGKRKLTKEELAAISRANGAKSRGATTSAGAAKARRGNYKHGLCCEVLPLETEDGGAIAETVLSWFGYYRPHSPIAHTVVKMCAHSDIMLDRCYTFIGTALDGQGKEVLDAWQESRHALVAECVALLPTSPDQAITTLKRLSHGCRWLLDEWALCQAGLLRYGFVPMDLWPDMVRLLGADPDLDQIGASKDAFLMALYNFQAQPQPAVEQIAALCLPQRRPVALAHLRLPAALPGPEECRQKLRAMVATVIDELRSLEAELRMGKDRADLEFVLKKSLVLGEGESSRQFLRYHKEWSSTFFRFSQVLPVVLERDASGFFEELAASYDDEEPPPDPPAPGDPEEQAENNSPVSGGGAYLGSQPGGSGLDPRHPEVAANETPAGDPLSSTLPTSAGLAVEEGAGVPDRVGFPDPPSSAPGATMPTEDRAALPPSANLAVAAAAGAPEGVGFPDPPSRMPVQAIKMSKAIKVAPRDPGADGSGSRGQSVSPAAGAGPPTRPALPDSTDRAPPATRGAPQRPDGDPRGVPRYEPLRE
jgi:hypothetical protein